MRFVNSIFNQPPPLVHYWSFPLGAECTPHFLPTVCMTNSVFVLRHPQHIQSVANNQHQPILHESQRCWSRTCPRTPKRRERSPSLSSSGRCDGSEIKPRSSDQKNSKWSHRPIVLADNIGMFLAPLFGFGRERFLIKAEQI